MPRHITLTDNNSSSSPTLASLFQNATNTSEEFFLQSQIHVYEDLQTVSGKTLKELCTKESSLLVFPDCLNTNNDRIEELTILDLVGSPKYSQDNKIENVDNVKIKTGNLMGFIGFNGKQNHGTQVEIRSRFTENVEKNKQDNFLHYMLEKVFNINLFNLNYTHSKNDGFDFIYLIFPHLLKKALKQGLLRKYRTYKKNDSNVKGVIDINRHIKYNTPFNGKVAYNSREYSRDNYITQLIRHTIEFIKQKNLGKNILSTDSDTILAVRQITEATQETYSVHAREKIIHKNLKPETHPYYNDYKPLQKLCMMILTHCKMQYSQSNSPVYGILFDGAWLWEEYLATILCDSKNFQNKFIHPTNKDRKGGIRLFDNSKDDDETNSFSNCYRRIYPDFYRENSKSNNDDKQNDDGIILDAKYKHLENGFYRDDLYQIISYMHTMKISRGGFIFPFSSTTLTDRQTVLTDKSTENETRLLSEVEISTYKLANLGGTISTYGIKIPKNNISNYSDFCDKMKNIEKDFIEKIISFSNNT